MQKEFSQPDDYGLWRFGIMGYSGFLNVLTSLLPVDYAFLEHPIPFFIVYLSLLKALSVINVITGKRPQEWLGGDEVDNAGFIR